MLKPLLLLCWTAIFVSAGDQKTNGTSGATVFSPQERATVEPLIDTKSTTIPSSAHVPSESDADKPKVSLLSTSDEKTPDSTTEVISVTPPTTKSTTMSTTSTTPSSTTPSSTTPSSTTTIPTTVPSNITTPAPTPVPPPKTKKWTVKQNDTLCIIVQMAAQFDFSYTVNNTTIQKTIDVPSNSNATGTCGNTEQNIMVSWYTQNDSRQLNNFTLHFVKNETIKLYSLHHFEISLAPEEFPADKWNKTVTLVHMVPQYETRLSDSYRCLKEQKLDLHVNGVNETVGHLTVSNLQFQAFRTDNKTIFGLAKDCAFDTPDIVPITVGCALAGLVVIVLIAYLVGRRRSQARGYLSM
ncbi:PREDICTED: lysosome-associated membrane glycoprotein 1-like [Dinoponera quadriceps]|uniref:Lysosome-associated membrane glycoprotein 5 n=1 Tax=Dinoponera quadriceps TaxID=609295 RepID=A0A6P3WZS7_DINQU|nr:PREDICTED: lysosome-associated membrane glycoprotein 1-like [Dinoponera quadriceps]